MPLINSSKSRVHVTARSVNPVSFIEAIPAKEVSHPFAPGIFQNPEHYHCHNGFVNCVVSKEGSSINFYYLLKNQGVGRSLSPVMVAQKKSKYFQSSKFKIFDTLAGSKQRDSFLGVLKRGQRNTSILVDASNDFDPPSQVATMLRKAQPSSSPVANASTRGKYASQFVFCVGSTCGDLLCHVIAEALAKHGGLSLAGVESFPELMQTFIVTDKNKISLKDSKGQELLGIKFADKTTVEVQYRAPFNAFQAFGVVLAHWSSNQ